MQRVEAVVQTGLTETRYVRAGRGAPVLLLFDDGAVAAVASQLLETLVSEFRLLLPALNGNGSDFADAGQGSFSTWLRNFMDGLGIDRFAVIATTSYTDAIAAFATTDPDRIRGVVVLATGNPEVAGLAASRWHPGQVHSLELVHGEVISAPELARLLAHLRSVSAAPTGMVAQMD
jgi:pimeloyl-ACP methyl ester carboxylesterase